MKKFLICLISIHLSLTPLLAQGPGQEPASMQDHSGHGHSGDKHSDSTMTKSQAEIWTCSMHPQIKLPKPGKCPICGMNLIPLENDSSDEDGNEISLKLSNNAQMLAEVTMTPVIRKAVTKQVRMVGNLDYDETRLTHITAWVPGRLDRMFVDYTGVTVKKGDHMIELYSPELISAQEELIQAGKSLKRLSESGSSLVKRSTEQAHQSAREKLLLLGLTEQQVKGIEKRAKASDKITIYAPTGGDVVERNATEGMYVQTGTRVYSIADLSTLWLHLDAYETDLPWLRYGQSVEFSTQAVPGKTFQGTISFISPVLDRETRTTKIRVIVKNTDGALKPGLFVNGIVKARIYGEGKVIDTSLKGKYVGPMHPEVIQDTPGECPICEMDLVAAEDLGYITEDSKAPIPLVIPVSAPLLTGKRAVVYIKNSDSSENSTIYSYREVTLGPRAGDFYIIESGLNEGELVVTNGAFKIDADLQIKGKKSMMNPNGVVQTGGHNHGDSKDKNEITEHKEHNDETQNSKKKPNITKGLTSFLEQYLNLSDSLANDDLKSVNGNFEKLKESSNILKAPFKIEKINFSDINEARLAYGSLSERIIAELEKYTLPNNLRSFKAFCPMALDGKGAFWLQRDKEIKNPYFGASMLTCGSIEGKL